MANDIDIVIIEFKAPQSKGKDKDMRLVVREGAKAGELPSFTIEEAHTDALGTVSWRPSNHTHPTGIVGQALLTVVNGLVAQAGPVHDSAVLRLGHVRPRLGGELERLPSGSFKESGTGVETNVLTMRRGR